MDYLEFIARVTSHIPDKGQVTIRYYGRLFPRFQDFWMTIRSISVLSGDFIGLDFDCRPGVSFFAMGGIDSALDGIESRTEAKKQILL
jgi:hypothetical protein